VQKVNKHCGLPPTQLHNDSR